MYLIFCISYNVPYNILVTMYLINVNLCTYTKGYPAKGVLRYCARACTSGSTDASAILCKM